MKKGFKIYEHPTLNKQEYIENNFLSLTQPRQYICSIVMFPILFKCKMNVLFNFGNMNSGNYKLHYAT